MHAIEETVFERLIPNGVGDTKNRLEVRLSKMRPMTEAQTNNSFTFLFRATATFHRGRGHELSRVGASSVIVKCIHPLIRQSAEMLRTRYPSRIVGGQLGDEFEVNRKIMRLQEKGELTRVIPVVLVDRCQEYDVIACLAGEQDLLSWTCSVLGVVGEEEGNVAGNNDAVQPHEIVSDYFDPVIRSDRSATFHEQPPSDQGEGRRRGLQPLLLLRTYVRDMLSGIHQLAKHGILHLDPSPENFVCIDGRAFVIDFGQTVLGSERDTEILPVRPHTSCEKFRLPGFGKPAYTSPQLVAGVETVSVAQQMIFALGASIWGISTGTFLFEHAHPADPRWNALAAVGDADRDCSADKTPSPLLAFLFKNFSDQSGRIADEKTGLNICRLVSGMLHPRTEARFANLAKVLAVADCI